MDQKAFDKLIKRLASVRVTRQDAIRGLAAGAGAALTGAVLVTDEVKAKPKKPQPHKVTICHKGRKTLSVSQSALQAHLYHGDSVGECG